MTQQSPIVHIVDDDPAVRESLEMLLAMEGFGVRAYGSAEEFLATGGSNGDDCLVTDVRMPGMSGLELLTGLKERRISTPIVVMTAYGDIALAVQAMKMGAVDFIVKPVRGETLVNSIRSALAGDDNQEPEESGDSKVKERFDKLSRREKDVLAGLLAGKLNKTIAYELGISVRTVESHRARLMAKTKAGSLSQLVRMALADA